MRSALAEANAAGLVCQNKEAECSSATVRPSFRSSVETRWRRGAAVHMWNFGLV